MHEAVADHVLARIVQTAASWYPADPLLPTTRMGPLVDHAHLNRVRAVLGLGIEQGARLLTGGAPANVETGGCYLEPTVLTDAGPGNVVVREEIFGPVLAVQTVRDENEAIAVAGDTPYGLAAAVWTADLGTAHRVARRLRAGTVWVNCYEEGDMNAPFGGVKLSGFGRDKSRHALDEYRDLKTTWIKYA